MTRLHRIDTHHHIVPAPYREFLEVLFPRLARCPHPPIGA
jgi:hypothetical protein